MIDSWEGYRRLEVGAATVVVARVCPVAEESPLLTEADHEHLSTLVSPTRRAQWSTCRAILRHELGPEATIRYATSGAPIVESAPRGVRYVSISHSAEWVAVMLSPTRCGVDIESVERTFSRVASRYISHDERQRLEECAAPHFEALMWSAEEAIYKYANQPGLDFIRDLMVVAIDTTRGELCAELYSHPTPTVHFTTFDNQILCHLAE